VRAEADQILAREGGEGDLDPQGPDLVEHVALRGPVLQALKIAVEPAAHVRAALVHRHLPARLAAEDCGRQPGGAGTDDGQGFSALHVSNPNTARWRGLNSRGRNPGDSLCAFLASSAPPSWRCRY